MNSAGVPCFANRPGLTSKSPEAIEHFRTGERLLDNLRTDEARREFEEALRLDPDFVLALAFHGQSMPGAPGVAELSQATAASQLLPEAEGSLVRGLNAERRGEFAMARAAYARVAQLSPGDFRGHYYMGRRLLAEQRYQDAIEHLQKAASLNPEAGGAQNMVGYAALRQRDAAGAIAAFTEYARILPQEPIRRIRSVKASWPLAGLPTPRRHSARRSSSRRSSGTRMRGLPTRSSTPATGLPVVRP